MLSLYIYILYIDIDSDNHERLIYRINSNITQTFNNQVSMVPKSFLHLGRTASRAIR